MKHPSEIYKNEIIKQSRQTPNIAAISKAVGINIHHVMRVLREQAILSQEILKEDIFFLAKHSSVMPRSVIAEVLGLAKPAVWRVQKKHNLNSISTYEDLDLSKVAQSFKFMIEEDWKIKNISELPKMLDKSFLQGGYYPIYKFMLEHRRKTKQQAPIIGIMAELAYPDELRAFQFRLPNNASHFENVDQLNQALWWSFEKMTGIDIDQVIHDENVSEFQSSLAGGIN